jgi:lipid-A-disaccharide synthase
VVARAPHLRDELFAPLAVSAGAPVVVVEGQTDHVLADADVAIVASGTVTVQAALHECPMVVVYRLSPTTYRLGRRFVRVDTFAMANLVAGRRVVPELIQGDFTPKAVADHAVGLIRDPQRDDAQTPGGEERRSGARHPRRAEAGFGRGGSPRSRHVGGA